MGIAKHRNRIKQRIQSWKCLGYFGYGHGRALKEGFEKVLAKTSVCLNLCPSKEKCRDCHHSRMDEIFPEVSKIVKDAAVSAAKDNAPVRISVITAMNVALNRAIPDAVEIKERLLKFKIEQMTDHYVLGQFENINSGLGGSAPGAIKNEGVSSER